MNALYFFFVQKALECLVRHRRKLHLIFSSQTPGTPTAGSFGCCDSAWQGVGFPPGDYCAGKCKPARYLQWLVVDRPKAWRS